MTASRILQAAAWLATTPEHRLGYPPETVLAQSPGEANRVRQKLSDEGLCGYIAAGA